MGSEKGLPEIGVVGALEAILVLVASAGRSVYMSSGGVFGWAKEIRGIFSQAGAAEWVLK